MLNYLRLFSEKQKKTTNNNDNQGGISVKCCSECKSPVVYKFDLCEKCYGELFKRNYLCTFVSIAKETDEVGYKEEL